MADPISLIAGLFSAVSGYQQYRAAEKAADREEDIARLNQANIQRETAEQKRLAGIEESQRRATAAAMTAASGVTLSGSPARFEQSQRQQFAEQMRWLDESAGSRSNIAGMRGEIASETASARGQAALWGGIGGGLDALGTVAGRRNWSWPT